MTAETLSTRSYTYGRHCIDTADMAAVEDSLKADILGQGPQLAKLEEEVAAYCGARYCLAVASGTAGLHLACHAVGVGPGSQAWTTPVTFVATANAVRYAGGTVGLVDIEPQTYNLDPHRLAERFEQADRRGDLPKAVIPVHFGGAPCDMGAISREARRRGCAVIEDGCHALGATYGGAPIGACTHSDATVFSLHPVKSITSGEGGLILTNDAVLYERMKRARSHGLVRGAADQQPWVAEMVDEGFNYRLTEMQCALARSQLRKLDGFVAKRRRLVARYRDRLADLPVSFQAGDPETSAWHIAAVQIDFASLGKTKRRVFDEMKGRGVELAVHYLPVHMHRFYQGIGCSHDSLANAEAYYERAFSLPLHPGLSETDVDEICRRLVQVIG